MTSLNKEKWGLAMTIQHFRDTRKINPTQPTNGHLRPDGSPDDNDRIEIGPTQLAFDEWAAAGLTPPDLEAMRCSGLTVLWPALPNVILMVCCYLIR